MFTLSHDSLASTSLQPPPPRLIRLTVGIQLSFRSVRAMAELESFQTLEETDRISSLPDCLILHILSFLKMPDAVNTSLLSSRWRYSWMSISCLDFDTGKWDAKTDKVTFINGSLFNYIGHNLETIRVRFFYKNTDDSKIDSLVYFAIRHKVENLVLDLYNNKLVPRNLWFSERYKLPRSIYKRSSFKSLILSFCDLNLPSSIHFGSLKTLRLELLDLSTKTITFVTSNCPLLEDFTLDGCNMFSDLNIVITNKKLKTLTIFDYVETETETEVIICAPYVTSLSYMRGLWREKNRIRNMKSLLEFSLGEQYHEGANKIFCEKDVDHVYVALLRDLYYVVKMDLCTFLVQVLSIREVQGMHPFCFSTTSLQLETNLTKWELPGISYLLKSSPRLKSLIIRLPASMKEIKFDKDFKDEFAFEEMEYWKSEEYPFSATLQNLEFVKFHFFSSTQIYGNHEDDVKQLRNKIEFAQFLLKNSVGLRKMIIKCGNNIQENPELLNKLTEELVLFPRASCSSAVDII